MSNVNNPMKPGTRLNLDRVYKEIAGENPASPSLTSEQRDEHQQQEFIARSIQILMEHTSPLTLMSMLVVALAYMADDHSVSRESLCKLLREAQQRHAVEVVHGG